MAADRVSEADSRFPVQDAEPPPTPHPVNRPCIRKPKWVPGPSRSGKIRLHPGSMTPLISRSEKSIEWVPMETWTGGVDFAKTIRFNSGKLPKSSTPTSTVTCTITTFSTEPHHDGMVTRRGHQVGLPAECCYTSAIRLGWDWILDH